MNGHIKIPLVGYTIKNSSYWWSRYRFSANDKDSMIMEIIDAP